MCILALPKEEFYRSIAVCCVCVCVCVCVSVWARAVLSSIMSDSLQLQGL